MEGALVNIQFSCRERACDCSVIVEASFFQRTEGATAIYEYNGIPGNCPKCGHRFLERHASRHDIERKIIPMLE